MCLTELLNNLSLENTDTAWCLENNYIFKFDFYLINTRDVQIG